MLTGISLRERVNTETLTAAKTLTVDELHKYGVQVLDPGGAGRDVNLPAEADSVGLSVLIKNSADAAEVLTIKDDGGSTICTPTQNESAVCMCISGSWYGLVCDHS